MHTLYIVYIYRIYRNIIYAQNDYNMCFLPGVGVRCRTMYAKHVFYTTYYKISRNIIYLMHRVMYVPGVGVHARMYILTRVLYMRKKREL